MSLKSDLVNAIEEEIEIQKTYLNGDKIRTIYFGGGTPSVLTEGELRQIMDALHLHFDIVDHPEITLEANPDDLSQEKLKALKAVGVNRLSIGIQSFHNDDLVWMNRSHNANQAFDCIITAQDLGLDNISIDLIFGSPTSSESKWMKNLEHTNKLDIPHISCYGLTVEPGTALEKMIIKGKKERPSEVDYADQFLNTVHVLSKMGYVHYEISNYAKNDLISQHNTNYWRQEKYLGLGPAAHSFNGVSRRWNINNNIKYIKGIASKSIPYEVEALKPNDIYNEYVMTGMRTMWGCKKDKLLELGKKQYVDSSFLIQGYIQEGSIQETKDSLVLTNQGKLIADYIISSLFINEEGY